MSALTFLKSDPDDADREEYLLPADKLVSGNPRQVVWNVYSNSDRKFFTGIWQSDVGKWRIRYTEEEYCHVLQGVSVITDSQGNAVTVSAGDRFLIPRGFVGTWEVVEPTRKIYVIYEAGD
jgi:uncharacterized cupin superfamily protein